MRFFVAGTIGKITHGVNAGALGDSVFRLAGCGDATTVPIKLKNCVAVPPPAVYPWLHGTGRGWKGVVSVSNNRKHLPCLSLATAVITPVPHFLRVVNNKRFVSIVCSSYVQMY